MKCLLFLSEEDPSSKKDNNHYHESMNEIDVTPWTDVKIRLKTQH